MIDAATIAETRAKQVRFRGLAMGTLISFAEHLDDYLSLAGREIEAKSLHMKRANLLRFSSIFVYTADIERSTVQKWINGQAQDGVARATLVRAVGDLRGYWKHLAGIGAAKESPDPFAQLTMAGAARKKRKAFPAADMVRIEAAVRKRNGQDGDFVLAAMYTGARAEEIATLKAPHIDLTKGAIAMPGTKTEAAPREVPIHPRLVPLLRRLVKEADGGYLFSGWRADKFGDRSKTATKRIRGDIRRLGFTKGHDFHSIRGTVITLLEDTHAPENIVAHIVGHKIKTMGYGLYSAGPSLTTKAKVLTKLKYPAAQRRPVAISKTVLGGRDSR